VISLERGEAAIVRFMPKMRMPGLVHRALYAAPIAVLLVCSARPADAAQLAAPSPSSGAAADKKKTPPRSSPYAPSRFAGRAGQYYQLIWGIDSISVKLIESGEMVRFSYRIVDPDKARMLNDKRAEAKQAGRSYWMTFSNKGRRVKRGDRVDVVIGQFKASNLVVD